MSRTFRFSQSGYCPTQNKKETILIDTVEIHMAGSPTPGYKKMGLRCDYASWKNCDISNDCPIYMDAPHDPYLA